MFGAVTYLSLAGYLLVALGVILILGYIYSGSGKKEIVSRIEGRYTYLSLAGYLLRHIDYVD